MLDERPVADANLRGDGESGGAPADLIFESFDAAVRSPDIGLAASVLAAHAGPLADARNLTRSPAYEEDGLDDAFVRAFVNGYEHLGALLPELAEVPGLLEGIRAAVEKHGGDPATLANALLAGRGEVCDFSRASVAGGAKRWAGAVRDVAPGLALEFELRRNPTST